MTNEDRINIVQDIITKYHEVWDERFPNLTIKKLMEDQKLNEEYSKAIWDAAVECVIEEGDRFGGGLVCISDGVEEKIKGYCEDISDLYLYDDDDEE